jgi:hypothetical protein
MPKIVELQIQERDLHILADLFKLRVLSTSQIRHLHFRGTEWYVYKRLDHLRTEGYVQHLPSHMKEKNVSVKNCHYITDKGIRLLVDRGIIEPNNNRRAAKFLEPHLQRHLLDLNEIYIQIRGTSWEWLNSVEIKTCYNLNRGNKIHGGLRLSGVDYAVYLLHENTTAEQVLGIYEEIKHNREESFLYRTIIFCKSPEAKARFGSFCEGVATHVLPYSEAGFLILRMMAAPNYVSRLWQLRSRIPLIPCHHPSATFAKDMTEDERVFVTELITQNQYVEDQLYAYSYQRAQSEGKEVIVLVHTLSLPRLKERFKVYPHIHFVEFDTEDIETIATTYTEGG